MTHAEIADQAGCSPATVAADIAEIRAQWRRENSAQHDRLRAEVLTRHDQLVAEAVRMHYATAYDKRGEVSPATADSGWIARAQSGLREIADLLGLKDAPPGSVADLPAIDAVADAMTVEMARAIQAGEA